VFLNDLILGMFETRSVSDSGKLRADARAINPFLAPNSKTGYSPADYRT